MGEYFEGFLQEESRNLGLTLGRDQGLAAGSEGADTSRT